MSFDIRQMTIVSIFTSLTIGVAVLQDFQRVLFLSACCL